MGSILVTFLICILIFMVILFMIWQISDISPETIINKIKNIISTKMKKIDDVDETTSSDKSNENPSKDKPEATDTKPETAQYSDIAVKTAGIGRKFTMEVLISQKPYKTFDVDYYPYKIGRDSKNDCAIDYPYVSTEHAILTEESDKVIFTTSERASNPPKQNGKVIEKTEVKNGTSIMLEGHEVELRFKQSKGVGGTLMYDTESH